MTDPISGFRLAVRDLAPYGAQLFMGDRWAFATGSAMPDMEATKLAGDLLSDYWSSINHRASCSWIEATSDVATSTNRKLRVLGVLGLNRRSPSALLAGTSYTSNTARVRVDSYPLSTRIRPSFTLSAKSNLTGSDSNLTGHPIDPPDDPAPSGYSELKLTPTNPALPTSLTATCSNYYESERALAGNVLIRVHLRDVNNPTHIPAITITVDQVSGEGPSVLTASYERVTATSSSGGFIASYTFPVSGLDNGTEPIRVHLSTATACDFIGLELVLDHVGYLYDSGSIDLSAMSPGAMLALRPDLTLPAGVVYVHVELSDFYAYTSSTYTLGGGTASARTATAITSPGDPDGRCHAGRFVAADALIFPISGAEGYNLQTLSSGEPSRTRSGSLRGGRANVEWTEADLTLIGLSRVLVQRIEGQLRALGLYRTPTLLVPDPGLTEGYTDEQTLPRWVVVGARTETHIGRSTGIDEDVDADGLNHTRDRWDMTLHLVEHNASRSGGI